MLTIGDHAPSFEALDQNQQAHRLSGYAGQYVILYFYPRDNTPGCTKEACQFRDYYPELQKQAVILGVSSDSVDSHAKFATTFSLPFPLLADPEQKIISAYGADGETLPKRSSFLIGKDSRIIKIYEVVKPEEHALQVLSDLQRLATT